jgi:hypothetical protein
MYIEGKTESVPRKQDSGKLVRLSATKDAVVDEAAGVYKSVKLAVVKEVDGQPHWFNFMVFGPKFNEPLKLADLPELQKCEQLLADGKKPLVQFRYYERKTVIPDKETGGDKIVTNTKMSFKDVQEAFRILEEDAAPAAPREEADAAGLAVALNSDQDPDTGE